MGMAVMSGPIPRPDQDGPIRLQVRSDRLHVFDASTGGRL